MFSSIRPLLAVTLIIIVLVPVSYCHVTSESNSSHYKPYYCSPGDDDDDIGLDQTCASINETGPNTLCHKCREECGPAILSVSVVCVECQHSHGQWMGVVVFNLSILTFLFFGCLLLRINVAVCPLNVIVYFYQISTVLLEVLYTEDIITSNRSDLKMLVTIYGFFKLNFFRYFIPPQCLNIGYINVLYFEYIVAAFPFLLCFIAYLLIKLYDNDVKCVVLAWRPFSKCFKGDKWNPRVTVINTYITFFLLSQSKVIFTTFKILYPVKIDNNTFIGFIPFFDFNDDGGNVSYFILLSISLTIVFIFVLPPVLLQVLYPIKLFRKCLNKCRYLRQDILNFLMDAFQGWYKDGTNGSHDYRYMSVVFVVLRLSYLPLSFVGLANDVTGFPKTHIVLGFVHSAIGVFYFTAQPYKHSWMNKVDGTILVLLGMILCAGQVPAVYKSVNVAVWIPVVPLLCGLLYLPYHLHVSCKKHKFVKRSRKWLTRKVKSHTSLISQNQAITNANQEPTETDMTSSISADRELNPRQYEESIYSRSQHNTAASASQAKERGRESPLALVPLLHRDPTGVVTQSMTILNTGCVSNDYGTTNRYTRLSDPYEI